MKTTRSRMMKTAPGGRIVGLTLLAGRGLIPRGVAGRAEAPPVSADAQSLVAVPSLPALPSRAVLHAYGIPGC